MVKLYDVKQKLHGESYDAVSLLALDAEPVLEEFAHDSGWELSQLISSRDAEIEPASEPEKTILHAELNAPRHGYISVDFVRYENNRLGVDNKVVIRACSPRGELAASVLRGLKLKAMSDERRIELLRSELDRLARLMDFA